MCSEQQSEDDIKSRKVQSRNDTVDSDSDPGEDQLSFKWGIKNKVQRVGLDHIEGTQNRGLQAKNLSKQKLNPRKRPSRFVKLQKGR